MIARIMSVLACNRAFRAVDSTDSRYHSFDYDDTWKQLTNIYSEGFLLGVISQFDDTGQLCDTCDRRELFHWLKFAFDKCVPEGHPEQDWESKLQKVALVDFLTSSVFHATDRAPFYFSKNRPYQDTYDDIISCISSREFQNAFRAEMIICDQPRFSLEIPLGLGPVFNHVQCVVLSNCYLETVPRHLFQWKNITYLDLSGNCIENLPDDLQKQPLEVLLLENNQIKNWLSVLFRMKDLAFLNLNGNPLKLDKIPEALKAKVEPYISPICEAGSDELRDSADDVDVVEELGLNSIDLKNAVLC
jgi:hypothetical protein